MFVDQAKITIKSGSGGRGCQSTYRDKYTRQGIPDGGNGGKGADIIVRGDRNLLTLLDYRYNKHFTGKHGGLGSGKNQTGKDAPDVIIAVPYGTSVIDLASGSVLGTLEKDRQELLVAKGGRGGRGNTHGYEPTDGEPGIEKHLLLDLKLIADAGIIGFPNAGKSTLVSKISHARPEIAAYPFTTKFPVLGVVGSGASAFVLADIPGLIEGSSKGKGLGDTFLRHVERTKVLLHLVDMSGSEGRDPLDDFRIIVQELRDYSPEVYRKPRVLVANKMDLLSSAENLKRFSKQVHQKVYPISAATGEGLEALVDALRKKINAIEAKHSQASGS